MNDIATIKCQRCKYTWKARIFTRLGTIKYYFQCPNCKYENKKEAVLKISGNLKGRI